MGLKMKIIRCSLFAVLLSVVAFAAEQKDLLVGVWKLERAGPGFTMVGYTEYTADGRCFQIARRTSSDATHWLFVESKWGRDGNVWQEVVRSNNPGLKPGKRAEVTLVELTAERMVYDQQGRRVEEMRAEMPEEFRAKLEAFAK